MAQPGVTVTGGVDTHLDTNMAAALDGVGGELGTRQFPTTAAGYRALLAWLASFGTVVRVGVEGTGSYGAGLARHLAGQGVEVVEVDRPNRQNRRRRGKSDPIDAVSAARAALSGEACAVPRARNGAVEAIRVLRVARSSARHDRTEALNQMRSLVRRAAPAAARPDRPPAHRRGRQPSSRLGDDRRLGNEDGPAGAGTAGPLPGRADGAPHRPPRPTGCRHRSSAGGPPRARHRHGRRLVAAGDNPERLRHEASFAHLCGVSPIEASTGKITRHRLNRGGDRRANHALWRVVMVRMVSDPDTRAYVERRTKEGKSKREIMRCLKRYVAREVYPLLVAKEGGRHH